MSGFASSGGIMSELEKMQGRIDVLTDVCFRLMETRLDKKSLYEHVSGDWQEKLSDKSVDYTKGAHDTLQAVFMRSHDLEPQEPAERSAAE